MGTDPMTGAFDTPEGLRVGALEMLNRALATVKRLPLGQYNPREVVASLTAIETAIKITKEVSNYEPRS
jgi:hypothetical protein